MAEDFVERMSQLADEIVESARNCPNEEQTKQSLIQQVILVLGYDIFNPNEVTMEYACDAPVLKARNGKPESVDYAIRIARALAILIEAKDVNENLDRHGGQLARYFMSTECQHAVLTNGLEWRFFSDLDRDNVMDEEPYRIIDMRSLSTDDIMFLSGFRKDRFSAEGLRSEAEKLRSEAEKAMYASKINDYIKRNIIDSMSDDIIKVITGQVCGSKSKATVDQFRSIIETEFSRCLAAKYGIVPSHVREKNENPTDGISTPTEANTEDTWPKRVSYSPKRKGKQFSARALIYKNGKTIVEAGSRIRSETVPKFKKDSQAGLAREKELPEMAQDENGCYIMDHDIIFDHPSTAASFVSGSHISGKQSWEDEDGHKLTL